MKKAILISLLMFCGIGVFAQADEADRYLRAAREHLQTGNKEKAEDCYNIYTRLTGKRDLDVENELNSCETDVNSKHKTVDFINGRYTGDIVNGKRHGRGTFDYKSGNKYVGDFRNNKMNGRGTYYYRDGSRYTGEFKNDNLNGEGTYFYTNGDKFVGKYRNGVRDGKGIYYYSNGDKFIGTWSNGYKHGRGEYHFSDGSIDIEIWENGTCIQGC